MQVHKQTEKEQSPSRELAAPCTVENNTYHHRHACYGTNVPISYVLIESMCPLELKEEIAAV
jgi:hypothetical protein